MQKCYCCLWYCKEKENHLEKGGKATYQQASCFWKLSLNDSRPAKKEIRDNQISFSCLGLHFSTVPERWWNLWYKTSGEFQFVYTYASFKIYSFNWAKYVGYTQRWASHILTTGSPSTGNVSVHASLARYLHMRVASKNMAFCLCAPSAHACVLKSTAPG